MLSAFGQVCRGLSDAFNECIYESYFVECFSAVKNCRRLNDSHALSAATRSLPARSTRWSFDRRTTWLEFRKIEIALAAVSGIYGKHLSIFDSDFMSSS